MLLSFHRGREATRVIEFTYSFCHWRKKMEPMGYGLSSGPGRAGCKVVASWAVTSLTLHNPPKSWPPVPFPGMSSSSARRQARVSGKACELPGNGMRACAGWGGPEGQAHREAVCQREHWVRNLGSNPTWLPAQGVILAKSFCFYAHFLIYKIRMNIPAFFQVILKTR